MQKDLTKGPVLSSIIKLAIPIIGSSFMQFAYNFTDMLWVGQLGSNAVAAVGTSGFFLHMGWAFASILMVGNNIAISQAIGRNDNEEAQNIAINALIGVFLLTIVYLSLIQVGHVQLIGFFELNNLATEQMAHSYLRWASVGLFFIFTTRLFTGNSNARGDSKTPFQITLIGVVLNIILDPIFIFVLDFGVTGAAMATLLSQLVAAGIFVVRRAKAFLGISKAWLISLKKMLQLARLGLPPSIQYMIFSFIAIVMAKIVAGFGSDAIAAQKIGLQIEAMTFMTVGGLNGAIMSFTGQNFGAKKHKRIHNGYKSGLLLALGFGAFMTVLFLLFSEEMVRWFVDEDTTVVIGAAYLRIVGLSQIFMCIEMIGSGVINGIGKTRYPATINISMTIVRVPLALWLSQPHRLGVNGIWYAILISTFLRGILVTSSYYYLNNKWLKHVHDGSN
ncbi:MATE family efflux transporter [Carboxylicivirga sp. M1479]|uniref:MATE family efflux transporter n=1 Tax=Carboxylicivirga sp. M1479 TaxID=2594476 RepID=UPI001177EE9D|nr:MATE family efflux transporter [Carboxylicivirga sp. M1479]TRX66056.1 MATE family efflux transporter [Carboxylicivirga sp. M1479]